MHFGEEYHKDEMFLLEYQRKSFVMSHILWPVIVVSLGHLTRTCSSECYPEKHN